jgi:hypothetical protein
MVGVSDAQAIFNLGKSWFDARQKSAQEQRAIEGRVLERVIAYVDRTVEDIRAGGTVPRDRAVEASMFFSALRGTGILSEFDDAYQALQQFFVARAKGADAGIGAADSEETVRNLLDYAGGFRAVLAIHRSIHG